MALTHLVDTSVLTRLDNSLVREALESILREGAVARAGISDLEIGFSARDVVEWDRLTNAIDAFPLIETTTAHVVRARQVQRLLAERRQRGRKIPDLLIAAAAEEQSLTVLHYDTDFDLIAEVTGQRTAWIVARGSID